MTLNQRKALLELNRHLAFHSKSEARKELLENINAMLNTNNGARAYKLIGDWKNQTEEYLIQHANEY